MDSELDGRTPRERPHGKVIRPAVVNGKLFGEIFEGKERVAGIEPLLLLSVAALDLAVVAGRVGANELVADAQLGGGLLKQCWQISFAVGKPVGEFKTVVRLDTVHLDPMACLPCGQLP